MTEVNKMNTVHAALVAKMTAAYEALRKEKDALILKMTQDMESQRSKYEREQKAL